MSRYRVTFLKGYLPIGTPTEIECGIYSTNIAIASSPDEVRDYYKLLGYIVVGVSEFFGTPKPGQPIINIAEELVR